VSDRTMILHAIDDYEAHGQHPHHWYQALDDVERHAHEIGPEPEPETATDTRRLYRVQMPPKLSGWTRKDRAFYDGYLCWADMDGRRDHNGAVAVLFDEGPIEGREAWMHPEWLEPYVMGPSTAGEW